MKRSIHDSQGASAKRGATRIDPNRARCATKLLCPDSLVTTLLGTRGAVKDQIQEETGTKMVFSNKNDYYPGTSLRVLAIFADDTQCLGRAIERVLQRIQELGEADRQTMGVAAYREGGSDFLGKEEGEFCFRLCLAKDTSGEIIGAGGGNIKQLRKDTGAKIFIENDTQMGHQMVRVIGNNDSILACLDMMMPILLKSAGTEEFNKWATFVNFSDVEQGKSSAGGGRGHVVASHAENGQGEAPRMKIPQSFFAENGAPREAMGNGLEERHKQLVDVIASLPPGTAGMAYSITVELPKILQDSNEDLSFVELGAGVQLNVEIAEEAPEGAEQALSKISVVGPLRACYAAHLMVVQRAKECEQAAAQAALAEELANIMMPEDDTDDAEVLRGTIRELRLQLRDCHMLLRNHNIEPPGSTNGEEPCGEVASQIVGASGKGISKVKVEPAKGGIDLRSISLKGGGKKKW